MQNFNYDELYFFVCALQAEFVKKMVLIHFYNGFYLFLQINSSYLMCILKYSNKK